MTEKSLYIMAGYDETTEKYLAGIQRKLYESGFSGTQTKGLPQHITLAIFPTEREEEIVNQVKQVAKSTEPFEVTFNHVGFFAGQKVLFIAPDTNRELLSLEEQFSDSFHWTPHTTMLIDEPSVVQEAMPIVAKEFHSFLGNVTSLHLYEFWPTRHILSVDLTK